MADKQSKEDREEQREIALKNLGADSLRDLAVAYFVTKGKDYGESDNDVIESHLYLPSMSSDVEVHGPNGTSQGLVMNALLGSREKDGGRYSGSVSESGIIKTAGNIILQSLGSLTVRDVLDLMNYKGALEGVNDGSYLSDLIESGEDDEKAAQILVGAYRSYLTNKGLSSAYGQRADAVSGSLEGILSS